MLYGNEFQSFYYYYYWRFHFHSDGTVFIISKFIKLLSFDPLKCERAFEQELHIFWDTLYLGLILGLQMSYLLGIL